MTIVERMRERVGEALTEEYLKVKKAEGWKLVGVEWEREIEGGTVPASWKEEVPYGMRVADDCLHLQENPVERKALELILNLIAQDRSLPEIVDELNQKGYRTRENTLWTQVAVFKLLPRLTDAHAGLRRAYPVRSR
jgi:hypothetical protein